MRRQEAIDLALKIGGRYSESALPGYYRVSKSIYKLSPTGERKLVGNIVLGDDFWRLEDPDHKPIRVSVHSQEIDKED